MILRGCGSSAAGRGFFMLAPCERPFGLNAAKRAGKFLWPALTCRPNAIRLRSCGYSESACRATSIHPAKKESHGRNRQEKRASETGEGQAEKAGACAGRG